MECPPASAFEYSTQDKQWTVKDSRNWNIVYSYNNDSTKTTLDPGTYLNVTLAGSTGDLYSVMCLYKNNEARINLHGGDEEANPKSNSRFYPTHGGAYYACYTIAGNPQDCNW
jgi:hypothetical protein